MFQYAKTNSLVTIVFGIDSCDRAEADKDVTAGPSEAAASCPVLTVITMLTQHNTGYVQDTLHSSHCFPLSCTNCYRYLNGLHNFIKHNLNRLFS